MCRKMINRPLDFLDNLNGKEVIIKTKQNKLITGVLLAFDIYINLVIDNKGLKTFIKGDNVQEVCQ